MHNTIQPATPWQAHRFHLLDGLRGVAALLVAAIHAPSHLRDVFFFPHAFMAVDFFFCLSGFVVSFSYETRLMSFLNLRDFARVRAIRLYPIAALGTLIGVATLAVDRSFFGSHVFLGVVAPLSILLSIAILPFPHGRLFPLDPPMWTLFMELLANLVYACMVRRNMAANPFLACISIASGCALLVQALHYGTMDRGVGATDLLTGLARVGFSFFCGVLLQRLHKRSRSTGVRGAMALPASIALTAIFLAILTIDLPFATTVLAQIFAVVLLFPLIVSLGARIHVVGRTAQLCSLLGTISYPLYIVHFPIFVFFAKVQASSAHRAAALMFVLMAILIVLAWAIAKFYDEPVRTALARRLRKFVEPAPVPLV
jgi:peptidoglycan/LPS O-acetylase OafA/YrhL